MNDTSIIALQPAIEKWISDITLFQQEEGVSAAVAQLLIAELRSGHTRKAYYHALRRFFIAVKADEITRLRAIDGIFVRRYLDGMTSKRGGKSKDLSRAQAYSALNRFFDAMVLAKAVDRNPCAGVRIEVKKSNLKLTPAFTPEEYQKLLANTGDQPLDLRDRALFSFLAHTAARIGAALKVTMADFKPDDHGKPRVNLDEKGPHIHSMPVSASLAADLAPYLSLLGTTRPEDFLFRHWNYTAGCFTSQALPYHEAQAMLRMRLARSGITSTLTFHSFRATAITRMLDTGTRLDKVQKMANHAQITTTMRYDRREGAPSEELGEALSQALLMKPTKPAE